MKLSLSQKQSQILTPQMLQSMNLLQMNAQELLEYLDTAFQENPVLEVDEGKQEHAPDAYFTSAVPVRRRERDSTEETDSLYNYGTMDRGDLYSDLISQVEYLNLEPDLADCAIFLIGNLQQNGWLDEDIPQLAKISPWPQERLEQALAALQSMEPAGIAARNLSECLSLQLLRQSPVNELALRIVQEELETLAKNRMGLLARKFDASPEEVEQACAVIRKLNPRPGMVFEPQEKTVYITPDIAVVPVNDHFEVLLNERLLPLLSINTYYTQLLKESDEARVKEYLSLKVQQAKWLLRAIEQRRNTLLSCARCILELQEEFFRKGPGHLVPLALINVAQRIGVHESTVSRAINGKYLQCSFGTFPLSRFFSRRLGTESTSPDSAKALLRKIIAEEDPCKPLSDQLLCEHMEARGCRISRRTVAKYRDELNIPNAARRKRHIHIYNT